MAEYLVCLLTSNNIDYLKLSLDCVLKQTKFSDFHINIVVNTLNENYYNDVINNFKNITSYNLKIIRTESNGKPGKGHNSIINIFKNNYKYKKLIMLDGDDFLYPDSIYKIDKLYSKNNYDVITLCGNTFLKYERFNITNVNNKYSFEYTFDVTEHKYIKKMGTDYNTTIATPFRLLSLNRNLINKYEKLYDEQCYTYDDYLMFLIIYKEYFKNDLNILLLSCATMYMYTKFNCNDKASTISKDETSSIIDENKICKNYIKSMNINELKCENLNIIPYTDLFPNYDDNVSRKFYIDILSNSLKLADIIEYKTKILFIDTVSWDYNTIYQKPLGGTPSAIFNICNILSKNNNILVLTPSSKYTKVSENLSYNTLTDLNIINFNADYIVFQGSLYKNAEFYKSINNNIKLICWTQHDVNVDFIKKEFSKKTNFDKFIFVSNWQKNRYLQYYNLDHKKCFVMQNAISENINLSAKYQKEKTLIYISSPYRGLLIAYKMFLKIKEKIPDIRFKVFSCFSRDFNNTYSNKTFNPLRKEDINLTNDYDRFYKNLYEKLIDDSNIDYYGSVPQDVLFKHLQKSMILFYPNTFPETCCTSILEAMALKCNVITSDLGALSETSNGFSDIFNPTIDVSNIDYTLDEAVSNPIDTNLISQKYFNNFIEKTIHLINNYYSTENQEKLSKQIKYISEECIWSKKTNKFCQILEI